MRDATIAGFLRDLAARSAAPGGGATAALHAAQAAALIAMVARYSDGPRQDAAVVARILAEADPLAGQALGLAGGATRPQADLVIMSARLAGLARDLLPAANRNLIGDLLAAAASVHAAAQIARVNIETSLPAVRKTDAALAAELQAVAAGAASVIDQAGQVVAAIRAEVTR